MPNDRSEPQFPSDFTREEIGDEPEDPADDTGGSTPASTFAATEESEVEEEPEPEPEPEPEIEPEPADDTADEPTDQSDESESSAILDQPFIDEGLNQNEAIALVGVTIPSYGLAAFVLQQMMLHGIHHAPPVLWVVFGVLVIIPITLLFGTELATRLLDQITNARRTHK